MGNATDERLTPSRVCVDGAPIPQIVVDAYDSLNNLRPTEANLSDVSAWVSSGAADRLWETYAAIVLPLTPTPNLWSSSSKLQRDFVQWLASPATYLKDVATDPKAEAATSKPVTHVIPPVAILMMGAALETGAKKYGVMNWRSKTIKAVGLHRRHRPPPAGVSGRTYPRQRQRAAPSGSRDGRLRHYT
jgi:hypothetical protein